MEKSDPFGHPMAPRRLPLWPAPAAVGATSNFFLSPIQITHEYITLYEVHLVILYTADPQKEFSKMRVRSEIVTLLPRYRTGYPSRVPCESIVIGQ